MSRNEWNSKKDGGFRSTERGEGEGENLNRTERTKIQKNKKEEGDRKGTRKTKTGEASETEGKRVRRDEKR